MSQQSNQTPNNQSIAIEDLAAKNAEEIKGGPTPKMKRDVRLKTGVADNSGLEDLDATNAGEIKGGPVFMKLDDIKGESAATSGSGGGAGKVQMQDIHFVAR